MYRLLASFKRSYTPSQYLSIDESMVSYKGRLSFIQYLSKKAHKLGVKAWVLAEVESGYTWGWRLYTGKEEGQREVGLAHQVVLLLLDDERLQNKGYVVVMDCFYSSPQLFKDLMARGFWSLWYCPSRLQGPTTLCTGFEAEEG